MTSTTFGNQYHIDILQVDVLYKKAHAQLTFLWKENNYENVCLKISRLDLIFLIKYKTKKPKQTKKPQPELKKGLTLLYEIISYFHLLKIADRVQKFREEIITEKSFCQ